jgi:outer membrane protein
MNNYFLAISVLFLMLLFPKMARCENIFPPNGNIQPSLNSSSNELPLTVADAVYLALQNNRDLKIAYLQRILDKKDLAEAESLFNPRFTPEFSVIFNNNQYGDTQSHNRTATLGANINWKLPIGGTVSLTLQGENYLANNSLNNGLETNAFNEGINFNVSQPLLGGFGIQVNTISIKQARLRENANNLRFKNTKAEIVTNTIVRYRSLLLAQERLKIEEISLENSRKDLERLQALFDFGRIPKNDLVERQADIAQQEVTLVTSQSDLEQAITDLTRILDLPIPKKLIAIEIPAPPAIFSLPKYAEMLELTLANSSTYLDALNRVETEKLNIIEARNEQRLDLTLNLGYGLNAATNTQNTGNLNSSVTLSREFGNVSRNNTVYKSQVGLQKANLDLENTRKSLEEDLKSTIRNVEDTFRQIKLAQQARQLAETRVINAKERKRLGVNISTTDIIDFEKGLVDAKNQELNAIINHLNSVTQIEQILGITITKWLKE